jgi:ATP-dependent helicase HrpA
VAYKVQELCYRIIDTWFALQKQLQKGYDGPRDLLLRQDAQQQLDQLVHPAFLQTTPWLQLQQLPRFLEALRIRLEKYPLQVGRDQEATRLLTRLWQQYQERRQYCERHELVDEGLDEYRWLLEELRVSLFAQALGTRVPVSEKRLQRRWQELLQQ